MNGAENITFGSFLCGVPIHGHSSQQTPYADRIRQAAALVAEAEYVLIGAGAGMSTAAGAVYGGTWFREHFAEFQAKYGDGPYMQDMYGAGFYPYPTEEAYWGYWSRQCMLAGIEADHTPLHKRLLQVLAGKDIFCLSTNADGQFEKASLPAERLFCTQGDYFHIQCARGCHQKRYEATALFRQMDAARRDCLVPSSLVPHCPVCGGRMNMNLRIDRYFVQDGDWHEAEKRFGRFLSGAIASGRKTCLLELGVGFNTPMIIRFPFEKLAGHYGHFSLVRLNLTEAEVPVGFGGRAVGIDADIRQSIEDMLATATGRL